MLGNPWGNDSTIPLLKGAMDVASVRHEVIASNIANMDTPGFKAKELNFKELLREYADDLEGPSRRENMREPAPMLNMQDAVFEDENKNLVERFDGNNVDIDHEMGKLAANKGAYNLASKFMNVKLKMLREAIQQTR